MRVFKRHLLIWSIGMLMPVWLFVADHCYKLFVRKEFSAGWLYVSIIAGALICAGAIATTGLPAFRRILFVFASWLMLAAEVLLLGVFEFARTGLTGIQ